MALDPKFKHATRAAILVGILALAYWIYSANFMRFSGVVVYNHTHNGPHQLIVVRLEKPTVPVNYREDGVPPCISNENLETITPGTLVSVQGHLWYKDEEGPRVRVCGNRGKVSVTGSVYSSELCALNLRKASAELDAICRQEGQKQLPGLPELSQALGDMFVVGTGTAQNFREAAKWYRFAALAGLSHAQFQLGDLYLEGKGVAQDYGESRKWLLKAAEQDNADAQFKLGTMYADGTGTFKSNQEALEWFARAASLGNLDAKRRLEALRK